MARRPDSNPDAARSALLSAGEAAMAADGFARFSARAVARAAGYSVGTIYHQFGTLDAFILAINTRTFSLWADALEAALAAAGSDRIAALVRAYFDFATAHEARWLAIFDHRRPPGMALNPAEVTERRRLTAIVDAEVAAALGRPADAQTMRLTRSLIATVHGHCLLAVGGAYALMNEPDPIAQAIARVQESIAAARAQTPAR